MTVKTLSITFNLIKEHYVLTKLQHGSYNNLSVYIVISKTLLNHNLITVNYTY